MLGKYFITRQADGICITNKGKVKGDKLKELSFSILQATGARITRVIYLSCPTCGRTRFDLQEAVKKVKAVTGHLTGLEDCSYGMYCEWSGRNGRCGLRICWCCERESTYIPRNMPVLKNIPQESAAEELLKMIEEDQKENNTFFNHGVTQSFHGVHTVSYDTP